MGASAIKSGELVTLQELNTSSPFFAHGNSLRVIGKLQEYSVETSSATIVEGNAKLKIDTQHLRDINFRIDSIYQFIGELHLLPENEGVLQARVGRNVDGIDLNLYHQSLQLLRQFRSERKGKELRQHLLYLEISSAVATEVGKRVVADDELLAAFGTDDYFLTEADVCSRNGP